MTTACCDTPHAAAWSSECVAIVDDHGGLDVHELATGRLITQSPAHPGVTLRSTKGISPRGLVAFGLPKERLFLVHEEGLQHVIPGEQHQKQFYTFPKLAALVVRGPHGRAFFASAKVEAKESGPYVLETYLADGQKSSDPTIEIEGELLALACVAGRPAWIVRQAQKTIIADPSGTRADLSYLGALRQAWLEPDGAAVFVTERVAGKPQRRRLFAGITKPDGRIEREQPIGEPADLKKRGGRIEARAAGDLLRIAFYGSNKAPSVLFDVGKEVNTRELEPTTFFALSPDALLAVVVADGVTTLRNVPAWTVRYGLARHRERRTPPPSPVDEPPTSDPRILLERRLRKTSLDAYAIEAIVGSLTDLDDAEATREVELVELALSHDRTQQYALALFREYLLAPSDLPYDLRRTLVDRVARGIDRDHRVGALIGELRSMDPNIAAAARRRLAEQPAVDIANAHTVLAGMVKAVLPELMPEKPCHRDEPTPQIGSRGWALLATFMARRLEYLLRDEERAAFTLALEQAATPDMERTPPAAKKTSSLALFLAEAAWKESRQSASYRPDLVGSSLRPIAAKVMKGVLATEGKTAALDLLAATDDELRRLDVVHALRERMDSDRTSDIAAAILRAGQKGKVQLWLARLTDGRYGLLWKERTRWKWTEGDRDTVLATVPEMLFEAAVMAAAQDRAPT